MTERDVHTGQADSTAEGAAPSSPEMEDFSAPDETAASETEHSSAPDETSESDPEDLLAVDETSPIEMEDSSAPDETSESDPEDLLAVDETSPIETEDSSATDETAPGETEDSSATDETAPGEMEDSSATDSKAIAAGAAVMPAVEADSAGDLKEAEPSDEKEPVVEVVEEAPEVPPTPDAEATPAPRYQAVHWLVRIAERAGIVGDKAPDIDPGTSARDAWGQITRILEISDSKLCQLVAQYFRLDVANLTAADPAATLAIPEIMVRKHHIFPLVETDRNLIVATCDPTDVEAERALGFTSGRTVVFQVASPAIIQDSADQRFSPEKQVESILGSLETESLDAVKLIEEMGPESISSEDASATPVVKLTNLIIREGIEQGASDIHIEPGRRSGAVRFRVDGVLRAHMELPMAALNRIISRIKILARMDIADRLRPQDGKARVRISARAYDLRVSTLPAGGGEKCVIRVLDSDASFTLDDLDLPEYELGRLRDLLAYRDGVVIVTGPTGSGKTTTLYGALREMATGEVNIMTVEDPVEYELPGITQTQVQSKQGMTFAGALRAMLRQDPDVILVGEIRDGETASTAAQAAMTGHLVLATIHANDSVSAVGRLADMGLLHSTIAQTLRGGLAQRLMRKVCPACAEPVRGMLTPEEQKLTERHEAEPMVRAVGCHECGFSGYKGRIPIVEVMVVGPRMQQAIDLRKGHMTLERLAVQGGMRTMHTVALEWVKVGKTTLVEVERVLGQMIEDEGEEETKGPPRVLIADDDEQARYMMRAILEKEGYEVVEAKDGHLALDALKADPDFSLLILDLSMPRLDGRQVLKQVRGMADTAALPVLVRTGTGTVADEAELLEAGADDYIDKTTDSHRFLARVKAILRRSAL